MTLSALFAMAMNCSTVLSLILKKTLVRENWIRDNMGSRFGSQKICIAQMSAFESVGHQGKRPVGLHPRHDDIIHLQLEGIIGDHANLLLRSLFNHHTICQRLT
ncbi:hypothetical protein H0G86_002506 [Trichoderma simmonsii]|uniref:Uncharacterized protein n=1 Tax=Trichoderma simmonsii TaxID=1491479 RepID=A0A8G0L6T4_9HYPO|nr:hypothetical protein H0G86_002506 [Trichoderma simmonsii]